MNPKSLLIALSLMSVLVFSTCSGSSGGSGPIDNPPRLLSASFEGSGADPVAGDTLRLLVSEAVTLGAGVLSDADFTISGGGTLGAITASPAVAGFVVVELTLGGGVQLTTGTSTLDFSLGQDVILDALGRAAAPSTAQTLTKADSDTPTIQDLTIADVHSLLNGAGPAGGTLQAPTTGFSIDVSFSDASAISPGLAIISSDKAVLVRGALVAPGENLAGDLTSTVGSGTIAFAVPSEVRFPDGPHALTVRVADVTGQVSESSGFSLLTKTWTAANQPFEAGQIWFLDTSRDLESFTFSPGSPTAAAPVDVVDGANSRSDLEDLFVILGLQSEAPLPNVSGTKDSNQVVMEIFEARVLAVLESFFTGVNVTFTFDSPGSFPSQSSTVPYASHTFSQLCIAGAHESGGTSGVLGLAIFDAQNQSQENDCDEDFQGSRLGVFLHTLVTNGEQASASTRFRDTYDPLTPARGGTPIGAAGDKAPLVALLSNNTPGGTRGLVLQRAIQDMARFTAFVVAHECGHSMGLVQNGAMPAGLYGGDEANFPGSSPGHLRMPDSVFSGDSLNVMTPAISYAGGLDEMSRFNSLNLAYLREQVVHN